MMLNINPVLHAIESHRASVIADEATFDDAGQSFDQVESDRTQSAEIEAFRNFVRLPCLTAKDVQSKIAYLLNGTVGDRDTLLTCLDMPEYGGKDYALAEPFLRSLLVEGEK
ncbi:hypothetical protein [Neorhizobium sp. NCHU2750]|uniref:hypothetical protein n=1 Tax=Neorhizobium sp. NCHU2750 TaxID=1825976 RepID=UPI000E71A180|nr:hypothetical protein NCHU2750_28380 [Neorhizobium sp. NCHU2750]